MTNLNYTGFYFAHEKYADYRELYKKCLNDPSCGISQKEAQKGLILAERFSADKEHSRLVAQEIKIYLIKNPHWSKKGKLVVPYGSLEKLFEFNFGKEIKKICEQEISLEEIVEKNATHKLEDGTEIRGTRFRKSHYMGPPYHRQIPNPYLDIFYDSSSFEKLGDFSYSFHIKTEPILLEKPREYHIKEYVLIDDELINETEKIGLPRFKAGDFGKPIKFSHLVFRIISNKDFSNLPHYSLHPHPF